MNEKRKLWEYRRNDIYVLLGNGLAEFYNGNKWNVPWEPYLHHYEKYRETSGRKHFFRLVSSIILSFYFIIVSHAKQLPNGMPMLFYCIL